MAVTNEEIIAALMATPTIKEAAVKIGISERTVYDRMKQSEFIEDYKQARANVLRAAVNRLNDNIAASINVIAGIMNDTEVNPAIRLQAAGAILNNAAKFTQRLQEAEQRAQDQQENNVFDFGL